MFAIVKFSRKQVKNILIFSRSRLHLETKGWFSGWNIDYIIVEHEVNKEHLDDVSLKFEATRWVKEKELHTMTFERLDLSVSSKANSLSQPDHNNLQTNAQINVASTDTEINTETII